jgi:hypothetical protein
MRSPDARFVSVRIDVMNGQAGISKGLGAILTTRAKNATGARWTLQFGSYDLKWPSLM